MNFAKSKDLQIYEPCLVILNCNFSQSCFYMLLDSVLHRNTEVWVTYASRASSIGSACWQSDQCLLNIIVRLSLTNNQCYGWLDFVAVISTLAQLSFSSGTLDLLINRERFFLVFCWHYSIIIFYWFCLDIWRLSLQYFSFRSCLFLKIINNNF